MLPTPTDISMMRLALDEARAAAAIGEVPIGAVVYRTNTGEVLSRAHNLRERDKNPAAHAEFLAIVEACRVMNDWRLNDCSLAVTLEPCPMCAGAIVNARVGRIVFGAPDPKAGAVRTLYNIADDPRLNHRAQIIPGVLEAEASGLLRAFFSSLRAKG
jgi:tRNA(adenine34) deaminase